MRRSIFLLCLGLIAAPGRAQTNTVQVEPDLLPYVAPAFGQELRADCHGTLHPDLAVIAGGLTARSVQPSSAHSALDDKLAAVREVIEKYGAHLEMGERVRSVERVVNNARVDRDSEPFVALQRLEISLDPSADLDALLDDLLPLGLDRFGADLNLGNRSSSPQLAVEYRFSDLRRELDRLHHSCRTESLAQWCEQQVPSGHTEGCKSLLTLLEPHFQTRSLSFSTGRVNTADGRSATFSFSYPWLTRQLDVVRLAGDVPLEVSGYFQYRLKPTS